MGIDIVARHGLRILMASGLALAVAACAGTGAGSANTSSGELEVRAADAAWTTGAIPRTGRCRECGGGGLSPALVVRNVPPTATALEVRFLDVTAQSLNWPHHHGTLRVATAGAETVIVAAVPERTTSLPLGMTIASDHGSGHRPKLGYLAPCACDGNNLYVVQVTAVNGGKTLARGRLELGHCCLD